MMDTHLDIPHLPSLHGFHQRKIYHRYNSTTTLHHQNHHPLLMRHHHFILVSNEHNQRRDIGVQSPIDINIKDRMVDTSQIRLQKWREIQRSDKEFLLAHESGYHQDNILKKLY